MMEDDKPEWICPEWASVMPVEKAEVLPIYQYSVCMHVYDVILTVSSVLPGFLCVCAYTHTYMSERRVQV